MKYGDEVNGVDAFSRYNVPPEKFGQIDVTTNKLIKYSKNMLPPKSGRHPDFSKMTVLLQSAKIGTLE
jgi:hypothetical protein